MFEQTFVETKKTKRGRGVVAGIAIQLLIVGAMTIAPMWYFDKLSAASLHDIVPLAPPPPAGPPPAPPHGEVDRAAKKVKVVPRQFDDKGLHLPKIIPKDIAKITEEELPPAAGPTGPYVVGGIPNGSLNAKGNLIGDVIGSVPIAAPPASPQPAKKEEKIPTIQRIRVGGEVQQAMLIFQAKPVYPPIAKINRVSGVVHLAAVIGKDGGIQDLHLITGHPLLVQAAMDAVRQWRYRPTLLNQEPVEVVTQIDVNFTLSQ